MRTLRFWLGMPLFNLLLILTMFVFPAVFPSRVTCGGVFATIAVYAYAVMLYGGIFLIPLLTGLYYPVERYDCRPLYMPAIMCFLGVFAVFSLVLFIFGSGSGGVGFLMGLAMLPVAFAIAAIETAGYSLGLFIAKKIWEAKTRRS